MTDPRLNLRVLQRVARGSGGRLIAARGDGRVWSSSCAPRVPAARVASRRDLWHNGWSFGLIVALLAAEWMLRRRWGLR